MAGRGIDGCPSLLWSAVLPASTELILPSDRFDLTIARDPQGNISTVTFDGRGYGHGVGMCQCGAIGRARAGWTCEQILTHYYTDVAIKKLY